VGSDGARSEAAPGCGSGRYPGAGTSDDLRFRGSGCGALPVLPAWYGKYYRYGVEVHIPSNRRVEYNLVTDPYSVSLSTNSRYSQIVDLSDPAFQPAGWAELYAPPFAAPEDFVDLRSARARLQHVG